MTKIELRKPRITKEKKREIAFDYKNRMPIVDIIKKYGIGLSTIYRIIRESE